MFLLTFRNSQDEPFQSPHLFPKALHSRAQEAPVDALRRREKVLRDARLGISSIILIVPLGFKEKNRRYGEIG
jgi:hypothetical protein